MDNTQQSFMHLLSAMSPNANLFLIITLWASIHDGFSLPVVKRLKMEATDGVPTHRERTRRCACSTPLDSECHYFCHLDIIWVNTPSKTTVYGLGSALSRRRRSICRCTCANPDDQTCTTFCCQSPEITSRERFVLRRQLEILSSLRAVAGRSRRALDGSDSHRNQGRNASYKHNIC